MLFAYSHVDCARILSCDVCATRSGHALPQDARVRAEACYEALRAACCLPVPGSGLAAAATATATVVTRRARLTRRGILRSFDDPLRQNETA